MTICKPGAFCVSVDVDDDSRLSIEAARRQADVAAMLHYYKFPSAWTVNGDALPANALPLVVVPKSCTRSELLRHLLSSAARNAATGHALKSVVMDPHEVRRHWDLLARHGCVVARPRTVAAVKEHKAGILRGGLWMAPLTCSFVGGSRRSVKSLLRVCRRNLVTMAENAELFHLHVNVSNDRDSWPEELEALQLLCQTADELIGTRLLRCVGLDDLPRVLTRKPSRPQLSILRAA